MHLLWIWAKRVSCRLGQSLPLLLICAAAQAQSLDITAPSPVRTNQLVGGIGARDLGDSRLTNHYYMFAARPGDLTITVESGNLNGDIDVFTAGSLRPLLKFTVYAEVATSITKTVFLRRREELILRVQARTPNDDEGIYQVRFGGTFEPVAGALLAKEDPQTEKPQITETVGERRGKRVSSVGARIEEPEPEPAEVVAATPEPTPAEIAEATPEPTPAESPAPETATERSPGRNTRGRRPGTRRGTQPKPTAELAEKRTEEAKEDTKTISEAKIEEQPEEEVEPATPPATRGAARRGRTPRTPPPLPEPEPESGPRLIIETRAGERIERFMTTIRRVTVERNQIVVVGRDGKIERTLLSDVICMSIEP
jgi:hypothetical protein